MAMKSKLFGRGTGQNPANRYEQIFLDPEENEGCEDRGPATLLFRDASRSVLAENNSPDIGFRFSLNPYRGCEHGCIYCYARPSHEYLGYSAGVDFESRLLVKDRAPELLREKFYSRNWQPQVVALSGNTDCYQPIEKRLTITRRCLEVFAEFRNPVAIITKNALVTRDIDLLEKLAAVDAVRVMISITTLDPELARRMEPRASRPVLRLQALELLANAGIPTGVMIGPVVPGLTDEEIPRILEAATKHRAKAASWILLRLPPPVDQLFENWLESNYPDRKHRVMNRLRECREGKKSDTRFGRRMRGQGEYAQHIASLFERSSHRWGLNKALGEPNAKAFHRPTRSGEQLRLFG